MRSPAVGESYAIPKFEPKHLQRPMPNMTSTPGFPEVLGTAGDCQGMPVHMRFLKYSLSPHQTTSDPSALEMEVRELTNSFDPRCNVAILHRLFLHNDLHCQVIEHFFEDVLELPLLGLTSKPFKILKYLRLLFSPLSSPPSSSTYAPRTPASSSAFLKFHVLPLATDAP
jgi:hypothetical protein